MRSIDATPRLGRGARRSASGLLSLLAAVAITAGACGSSAPSFDRATANADIAAKFGTVFNLNDKSLSPKIAAIQDGSAVKSSFNDALTSSLATAAQGSKIDSTTILSDAQCAAKSATKPMLPTPCAKVTYDLLGSGGSSLLSGQTGYAVYVGGQWLVAKATICVLLGLFYNAEGKSGSPPGC